MREPIKVVVVVEAGMVQDIFISSGHGEAYILDYDIEGLAPDEIMTVSFAASAKQEEEALVDEQAGVTHWDKLAADPKFIARLAKDFTAHEKRSAKSIRAEAGDEGQVNQATNRR